jgi:hypothetical protein
MAKYIIEEEDESEIKLPKEEAQVELFNTRRSLNLAASAEIAISKIDELPNTSRE